MIRDNVKIWCKRAGISQAELARRSSVSRQRFSRMMNDPYLMTFGVMEDAATQLGCTLADLLGYDGESQAKLDKMKIIMDSHKAGIVKKVSDVAWRHHNKRSGPY